MLYAVLILSVTNLVTLIALGVVSYSRFWHKHDWNDWSNWLEDVGRYAYQNYREAIRYRVCYSCNNVQKQITGGHYCHVKEKYDCPHLKRLMEDEIERIKRLEKDLGL